MESDELPMPEKNTTASDLRSHAMNEFRRHYVKMLPSASAIGALRPHELAGIVQAVEDNIVNFAENLRGIDRDGSLQNTNTRIVRSHLADVEQYLLSEEAVPLSASSAAVLQQGIARIRDQLPSFLPAGLSASEPAINRGGRPKKWDWEGALIHLIAIANKPDGLPEGERAQARITRLMLEWFAANSSDGNTPAESEAKSRARRVMEALPHQG